MPRAAKKQKVYVVSEMFSDGAPQIHGVFTNANRAAKIQEKHQIGGAHVFMSTVNLNEEDFVGREAIDSTESKRCRGFLRYK